MIDHILLNRPSTLSLEPEPILAPCRMWPQTSGLWYIEQALASNLSTFPPLLTLRHSLQKSFDSPIRYRELVFPFERDQIHQKKDIPQCIEYFPPFFFFLLNRCVPTSSYRSVSLAKTAGQTPFSDRYHATNSYTYHSL